MQLEYFSLMAIRHTFQNVQIHYYHFFTGYKHYCSFPMLISYSAPTLDIILPIVCNTTKRIFF